MPLIELLHGKKYVHMGMGKTFVKGKPQEVTAEEAEELLTIKGKVGPTLLKLVEKHLFGKAKKSLSKADKHSSGNGDGLMQPARRRGRPAGKRSTVRVRGGLDKAAAKKAAEAAVELEHVD